MAQYGIEFTEEARADLACFSVFEQRRIVDEIRRQLMHEPTLQTRNRKMLHNAPVARWELRVGKHRVFYEVAETTSTVTVGAVGSKEHNTLYIRGEKVQL
jgi:mRNA-degrading endonuclease RelE of RelBE toxin-antitoxin system